MKLFFIFIHLRTIIEMFYDVFLSYSQFLPQDKVAEFAHLTPTQLLRETEATVDSQDLLTMHLRLIELNENERTLGQEAETTHRHLDSLKLKNQTLERDVARIKDRERQMEKVRFTQSNFFLLIRN